MTTTGMNVIGVHDQNLEKQIEKHMGGCMAGFFNILSSKRLYPKRLPPSEPLSGEIPKPEDPVKSPAPAIKSPVPSPWKFSREAPRLSLDSRAVVDAKGGLHPREIRTAKCGGGGENEEEEEEERESRQRRSPSVIARLMGLEACPNSKHEVADGEVVKKVEVLKRSASESRSRDYKFLDAPTFLSKDWMSSSDTSTVTRNTDTSTVTNNAKATRVQSNDNNGSNNPQQQQQRRRFGVEQKKSKCYYDTADVFPRENKYQYPYRYQNQQQQHQHLHQQQQQHQAVTIYGEIERRLRMRGIDEPSKDLETLKHILEALQLKGLLHSSTTTATTMAAKPVTRRNVVFDRRNEEEGSPIVVMKPARTPRRSAGEAAVSPRRERPVVSNGVRRKGGPLRVETTTTTTATAAATTAVHRRSINSPAQSPRRRGSGDQGVSRSPRGRRSTVEVRRRERGRGGGGNGSGPEVTEDEEVSTVSESSFSTNSHIDNERWRVEEYREGRNLLERCDKLLHSIAEMNSSSNSNSNLVEMQQPSPVSVLDSSFYKEDESSPSPVKKRTIDFKDQVVMELEEDLWSPSSSTHHHHHHHHHHHNQDIDSSDDSDFTYVSEVLRASYYFPDETHSDLFLLLEKQTCSRKDRSKPCVIQRKLVFDTITEILDRNWQLPPWKAAAASPGRPKLQQIWAEFRRIREQAPSDDLLEVICGVLKKDLTGDAINGWGDCHVEVSEAVLDIERLIFKDLIGETIRDLVATAGKSVGNQAPRRKLVF